ncbi:O-acetylhomoserine aminocarboxypropyltransferase/cysteine synthase family protein [Proteocatella sphenisci]|uniref:O-acetylhomoserine aminocarboxypropyltransferase/cysteine synthase family protein n=1 Tax=Proteocatella sphenisci TaxID=181070 RepID=UPI00048E6041|nr:O-acetylhomoserine aminocarboxypropyltransferase/cysteine synthase family protein [Proteocatella sphenisci]
MKKYARETQCIQSGYKPKNGEPRILPIFQSTTYKYDDADEVGKLFDLEAAGHMYSRISNPTVEAFENKIAEMEGGVGALATSSGQAATLISVLTICNAGEHLLAMSNLYGGTFTLFTSTLKKMGIEVTFVDHRADEKEIQSQIKLNTKLIFGETIGNPGVDVLDIERIAKIAHDNKIPLVVDNTFATPYLCRPFEFGADIITHSTTKYIDGHATSVGGIIVDSGKFDWKSSKKFPHLTQADPSYHGISYTEKFGEAAYITKARVAFLRDMGSTMSPFNAFLTNLGVETLALRMQRHSSNALAAAKFLENHPNVSWVNYPLLESSQSYELAKKYLSEGASGIISFGVKGGVESGKKFINNLKLASLVVHVGDIRTHVLHPASMTHRQLSQDQQLQAGIKPDMIRLSVGIENIDDILQDLDQALKA